MEKSHYINLAPYVSPRKIRGILERLALHPIILKREHELGLYCHVGAVEEVSRLLGLEFAMEQIYQEAQEKAMAQQCDVESTFKYVEYLEELINAITLSETLKRVLSYERLLAITTLTSSLMRAVDAHSTLPQ